MTPGGVLTRLRVPPLTPLPSTDPFQRLGERIHRIDAANTSFVATFGVELKAATLLSSDGSSEHRAILQRLLGRPAVEPILLHCWTAISAARLTNELLTSMASGLSAEAIAAAHGQMRTTPDRDGNYTVYASPEERELWPNLIAALDDAAIPSVAGSLCAYAAIILCHPLKDANGRVARALCLGRLARAGMLTAPVLPLGPAFYLHRRRVAVTMANLSRDGNWGAASESLRPILVTACDLAEMVAAKT